MPSDPALELIMMAALVVTVRPGDVVAAACYAI